MKYLFAVLSLLVCVFSSVIAEELPVNKEFRIAGQVVDSLSAEAVMYATLRISKLAEPAKLVKMATTDDKGKFVLSLSEAGEFLLEVQYVGKKVLRKNFRTGEEARVDLGVLMMQENAHQLSEVVVSAAKPLVTVDLDKIVYDIEADPDSKTNNVLDMLRKVPLVTVDGEEKIQLKGSSNFKIYMNGKPSNMISSNPKDVLKSMPAHTIKDIQVITDPGAKYDAEGVSGIINIVTKKNASLGGYTATLRAGANSLGGFDGGAYWMMKYGKVGFNGNYSYYQYRNPENASYSRRVDYLNPSLMYLNEDGTGSSKGMGQYGSGELSFEIDTFSLINMSFNLYGGDQKSYPVMLVEMKNSDGDLMEAYRRQGASMNEYGNTSINADYQRTFKMPDRLLTASYRFSLSPSDWSNLSETWEMDEILRSKQEQLSEASMKEHTLQVDYTTPISKIHVIETGVKYILRLNNSNSHTSFFDTQTGAWNPIPSGNDEFEHTSEIYSAYAGYSLRLKSWGLKTGVRYEGTQMNVAYPLDTEQNFDVPFKQNVVPSATVTYKIKPTQNIRLGYNMRINRPGIGQLNPYVNAFNPTSISYGNPGLRPVENHSIHMNYGSFSPKFNLNANVSYSFANNSIESITTIDDEGVSHTTYDNIGRNRRFNFSSYQNWKPTAKFSVFGNLMLSYTYTKSNKDAALSSKGWSGGIFAGADYTLPWSVRFSAFTGYFGPRVSLQGKTSSYSFHDISFNKSFLKDRLNVRLSASNPFVKEIKFKNTQYTVDYHQEGVSYYSARRFGVSVSYRIGELKTQIKKVRRGISNDDVIQSGSGGEGQQGGSPKQETK